VERDEPLKIEINHFIDCVNGEGDPLTPGRVGLNALKTAQAALDSSKKDEAVSVVW